MRNSKNCEFVFFCNYRGGLLCKWECSTEPENWEPHLEGKSKLEGLDLIEFEESGPGAKKTKEASTVTKRELTKFCLDSKNNLLKHRVEDGKQSYKNRACVMCVEVTEKREFAVVGFSDGVILLVGLPSGELVQELRFVFVK